MFRRYSSENLIRLDVTGRFDCCEIRSSVFTVRNISRAWVAIESPSAGCNLPARKFSSVSQRAFFRFVAVKSFIASLPLF